MLYITLAGPDPMDFPGWAVFAWAEKLPATDFVSEV